eukprot:COSAG06_NODE_26647_length_610_cov_0.720157_1_plen_139_part_01
MEACRSIGICKPVFARGVHGEWGDAVTAAPLGREQVPVVGWDLQEEWLVTGLAVRNSLSMAAAAAAAVSGGGGSRPTVLGLEVAQSAEDLQDDAKCTPVATFTWSTDAGLDSKGAGSNKGKGSSSRRSSGDVGVGSGPA